MSIYRYPNKLFADPKRVILRFLDLGENRTRTVLNKILKLSEKDVSELITGIFAEFAARHRGFEKGLLNNFHRVEKFIQPGSDLSDNQKLLIGAYFSKEYSIEAAALFNPSITVHPDQSGLDKGELRFIISLRATGEGHISSIEFRSGKINSENNVSVDKTGKYADLPEDRKEKIFSKDIIRKRTAFIDDSNRDLFESLPEEFTGKELHSFFAGRDKDLSENPSLKQAASNLADFTDSNYEVKFEDSSSVSERVLFPLSKSESAGLEDLRMVRFDNGDGSYRYYGTYTAYNGFSFRVQLMETDDFKSFAINTLHGNAVQDKGMALFPRKINGKYMMISRQEGVNIGVMSSDSLFYWDKFEVLKFPREPWELIQLGNCGSPLETKDGWLLITHAVGPFRKYVISACMLDLNNPGKIIGTLKDPLIAPDETEREGYVPNVVYSCGSILHDGNVIIPYAMSDSCTGFAGIPLSEIINKME